jgi:hypothetical protein
MLRTSHGLLAGLALAAAIVACDSPSGSRGSGAILVQNGASVAITEVRISDCESESPGSNLLAAPLAAGAERGFTVQSGCQRVFIEDSQVRRSTRTVDVEADQTTTILYQVP